MLPDWIYAVILGVIEGLTEFIPVSSTGMMLLAKKAMGLPDGFWDTFAVMGPGSKKGLNLIMGVGTTEINFKDRLTMLRTALGDRIPKMHNQDLQNCLCEFSKYVRYLEDNHGRRRIYNAHA